MSPERTGTITFRAGHEDLDWLTNNKLYRLKLHLEGRPIATKTMSNRRDLVLRPGSRPEQ